MSIIVARFTLRRFRPISLQGQLFKNYNLSDQIAIWKPILGWRTRPTGTAINECPLLVISAQTIRDQNRPLSAMPPTATIALVRSDLRQRRPWPRRKK